MQIDGEWYLCDDGIHRPILRGHVEDGEGFWLHLPFLVDVGADQTVFSAHALAALDLTPVPSEGRIGGVGGFAESIAVETTIRLRQRRGEDVTFVGQFAALTDPVALDMSVLGRDITNLFAAIVDRPGNAVCLLGQRHRYVIVED